jgi:hypothetical protein
MATWVIHIGYLGTLMRRYSRLKQEIKELERLKRWFTPVLSSGPQVHPRGEGEETTVTIQRDRTTHACLFVHILVPVLVRVQKPSRLIVSCFGPIACVVRRSSQAFDVCAEIVFLNQCGNSNARRRKWRLDTYHAGHNRTRTGSVRVIWGGNVMVTSTACSDCDLTVHVKIHASGAYILGFRENSSLTPPESDRGRQTHIEAPHRASVLGRFRIIVSGLLESMLTRSGGDPERLLDCPAQASLIYRTF